MLIEKLLNATLTQTVTGPEDFSVDLGINTTKIIQVLVVGVNGTAAQVTFGFSNSASAGVVETFSKNGGTAPIPINTVTPIVDRTSLVVTDKRYLRLTIDHTSGDTVNITISYLSIPSTHYLANNYGYATGTIASNTTTNVLSGDNTTARIPLSNYGSELNGNNVQYTISAVNSGITQTIQGLNSTPASNTTITDDYLNFPNLLSSTDHVSIFNSAASTGSMNYYISYRQINDPV